VTAAASLMIATSMLLETSCVSGRNVVLGEPKSPPLRYKAEEDVNLAWRYGQLKCLIERNSRWPLTRARCRVAR
jgi:hypothetical protein